MLHNVIIPKSERTELFFILALLFLFCHEFNEKINLKFKIGS